jgi:CrcB protein
VVITFLFNPAIKSENGKNKVCIYFDRRFSWTGQGDKGAGIMNLMPILLAGFGGAFGAVLRYLVSGIYPVYRDIPTGTLVVNFTGSTILSMITFGANPLPYFADAGILGGFTTFSAFGYESFRLLEQREFRVVL